MKSLKLHGLGQEPALVFRAHPNPVTVRDFLIQEDKDSKYYGWLFIRDKHGDLLPVADLKPHIEDIRKART